MCVFFSRHLVYSSKKPSASARPALTFLKYCQRRHRQTAAAAVRLFITLNVKILFDLFVRLISSSVTLPAAENQFVYEKDGKITTNTPEKKHTVTLGPRTLTHIVMYVCCTYLYVRSCCCAVLPRCR